MAEDNIQVKFKDYEGGQIPHIEMLNKENMDKDSTFKNMMIDKFDSKISMMSKKYKIGTAELKE